MVWDAFLIAWNFLSWHKVIVYLVFFFIKWVKVSLDFYPRGCFPVLILCFFLYLNLCLAREFTYYRHFRIFMYACSCQMVVFRRWLCLWCYSWPWFTSLVEVPVFGFVNQSFSFSVVCTGLYPLADPNRVGSVIPKHYPHRVHRNFIPTVS